MSDATPTQRLVRPLAVVIAVVFCAGTVGAIVWDDGRSAVADALGRGDRGPGRSSDSSTTEPGADTTESGPDAVGAPEDRSIDDSSRLPSAAAVPEAGEHRYEVRVTRNGTSETVEELRRVEVLEGGGEAGRVRLEVQTGDQRQISILDWKPSAVEVVSTRVPTASGGDDCSWDPPFLEFGPLSAGSEWAVSSTCTASVGGVPSTLEVTGSTVVVGDVQVSVGSELVTVWRIERSRTTVIRASIGGEPVEQRVDEHGDLYLDPVRGIVVQSDVTLTTTGEQSGTSRRQSTLIA